LPLLGGIPASVFDIAREHRIPVLEAGALGHPDTLAALRAYEPDALCAACFPRRLPADVLGLAPLGALNVHPSLLPAYRGPAPLFWVLRDGAPSAGVTVHLMDEGLDTGPIVERAPLPLPEGASGAELDRLASELGGELLARAVVRLRAGTAVITPQPVQGASYCPWPSAQDFRLVAEETPARRAYGFIRGVDDWPAPVELLAGGKRIRTRRALGYADDVALGAPWERRGRELWVRCSPGTLRLEPVEPD
jgi:methionyl-tRNA formyltransferase